MLHVGQRTLALLAVLAPVAVLCAPVWITVLPDGSGGFTALTSTTGPSSFAANSPATAHFDNLIEKTGWSFLNIETNPAFSDQDQAKAAGYAEGFATEKIAEPFYRNSLEGFCTGTNEAKFCEKLRAWRSTQAAWAQAQAAKDPNSEYWHQHGLMEAQMAGLLEGLNAASGKAGRNWTDWDIYLANAGADIGDVQQKLEPGKAKLRDVDDGCSSLVKWVKGRELYASQITWTEFNSMIRIYKRYNFNFRRGPASSAFMPGREMTFSGYPLSITSGDDFYQITDSSLVAMETTNGVNNQTLYDLYVVPETVMEFYRSMIANRLADSGQQWASIFSYANSGTYNNQWIVVSYLEFDRSSPVLQPGTVWVLEQVPGFIVAADQTTFVSETTMWKSFNTPFYPFIFNISGQQELVDQYGDWFTWAKTPRSLIFDRNGASVASDVDMMKIMRYNKFQTDPLSKCDCTPLGASGENAIAARSDLNPANGTYPFSALGRRQHGAIDAKVTSSEHLRERRTWIISGPTADNQPPFDWSTANFPLIRHEGMPDRWDFSWNLVKFPDIRDSAKRPVVLAQRKN